MNHKVTGILKSGIAFLLGVFIIISPGCHKTGSLDVIPLLEEISEQYRGLENFQMKAEITTEISAGLSVQTATSTIYYAVKQPGSFRLDVTRDDGSITLVTDGNTTWTYLPDKNQYTVEQSSPLQFSNNSMFSLIQGRYDQIGEIGHQLKGAFENITENLQTARYVREDSLSVNNESRDVYVIEVQYNRETSENESTGKRNISPTIYWVDRESKLVLRKQVTITTLDSLTGKNIRYVRTIDLKNIDGSSEFGEKTFTFNVPESAERVAELAIPRTNQKLGLIGDEAINFELRSVNGELVSLDQFRGNVVILDFWATWCGPCLQIHPYLDKLQREFREAGLVVLGINSESPKKIADYMERYDYVLTNLIDTDNKVTRAYRVSTIPSLYIINRQGKVFANLVGYKSEERIREAIKNAGI